MIKVKNSKKSVSGLKSNFQKRLINLLLRYGIYLVFVLLCIGVSIATPVFLTVQNLTNILLQTSAIGIVAVGMTFVIIARGIDVSVGSTVALASAVAVIAMKVNNQPWWIGLLLFFGVALISGVVNGFSSAFIKMPSFLTTLATMIIFRGLVIAISKGRNFWGLHNFYQNLGFGMLGPIPIPATVMVGAFLLGYFILSHTVFGRHIYAVGGNTEAARVSGINVERIKMLTFVVMGFFCGLSSLALTSRLNSFTPTMAIDFPFIAIAAVVIGGTSLFGGEGNMSGTFIGVLVLGVVNNALNLLSVSPYYQDVARGMVIFLAVMIDALRTRFARPID